MCSLLHFSQDINENENVVFRELGHFSMALRWRSFFFFGILRLFFFRIVVVVFFLLALKLVCLFQILKLNSYAAVKCCVQFKIPVVRILEVLKPSKISLFIPPFWALHTIRVVDSVRVFYKQSDVAPMSFYHF